MLPAPVSSTFLDDPNRFGEIRARLASKPALRAFYQQTYEKFAACLQRTPNSGKILEIGSGAGFLKAVIPDVITSDILPYPGVDAVVDATALPFPNSSLRLICLLNTFHHIADVEKFLSEAVRCLVPGGKVFMVDHHRGWLSDLLYRYGHSEPFDPSAPQWRFETSGPLSGANAALSWIVFRRDLSRFERRFPNLQLVTYRAHSPLLYWLSGGLKNWTLVPGAAVSVVGIVDEWLGRHFPSLCSFADIELQKLPS